MQRKLVQTQTNEIVTIGGHLSITNSDQPAFEALLCYRRLRVTASGWSKVRNGESQYEYGVRINNFIRECGKCLLQSISYVDRCLKQCTSQQRKCETGACPDSCHWETRSPVSRSVCHAGGTLCQRHNPSFRLLVSACAHACVQATCRFFDAGCWAQLDWLEP